MVSARRTRIDFEGSPTKRQPFMLPVTQSLKDLPILGDTVAFEISPLGDTVKSRLAFRVWLTSELSCLRARS